MNKVALFDLTVGSDVSPRPRFLYALRQFLVHSNCSPALLCSFPFCAESSRFWQFDECVMKHDFAKLSNVCPNCIAFAQSVEGSFPLTDQPDPFIIHIAYMRNIAQIQFHMYLDTNSVDGECKKVKFWSARGLSNII